MKDIEWFPNLTPPNDDEPIHMFKAAAQGLADAMDTISWKPRKASKPAPCIVCACQTWAEWQSLDGSWGPRHFQCSWSRWRPAAKVWLP